MSDDQQLPQSGTPTQDPTADLEALLAKAKENRGQSTTPELPAEPQAVGPSPEELQAQQQAELAQMEAAAQVEQSKLLEQQRRKLEGLKDTPEFQARQQQNDDAAKQRDTDQAAQQGHVIRQITETKV